MGSQSDGSITHQVMDRDPNTVGETLPPHLSPFVSEMERRVGDYVPPEQKALEEGKVQNLEDEDRDEEDNGNLDDEEEDSGNEEEDSGNEDEIEENEEFRKGT